MKPEEVLFLQLKGVERRRAEGAEGGVEIKAVAFIGEGAFYQSDPPGGANKP